ncbi:MAG: ATP-grasp domain-containing protein [Candidatus Hodarchaeales archaeon]|jgi:hypothetical protein
MLEYELDYVKTGSFVKLLGSQIVFMHDINTLPNFSKIISQVDGIEKYERALPVARQNDVVITKNPPDKSYQQWLEEIGLGSRKILVVNGDKYETLPERVMKYQTKGKLRTLLGKRSREAVVSPYFGGPLEQQASSYLELDMYAVTKSVNFFDSKINFKNMCQELGVPVLEDKLFTVGSKNNGMQNLTQTIKESMVETGKVIVKGEFGASASTTYVLDGLDSTILKEIATYSRPGDHYLIEPFYETLSQPSSVWFITKDQKIIHLKTSNQLLDEETSHVGNEFPVNFNKELIQQFSFKIAKYLSSQGFVGPFGIDFFETKSGMFAAECNPRVTGAMYPWELVHRLDERNGSKKIKAARAQNIHLPRKGLQFKDLISVWDDVLFNGQNGEDVIIPFNVGPIAEGKITVLGTGSSLNKVDNLFCYLKDRLMKIN